MRFASRHVWFLFFLAAAPHMARANIGCFGQGLHPVTMESIQLPGQEGYDSEAYGRLLYAHLRPCLEDVRCIAVQAELKVKWDSSIALPHEKAMKQQEEDYEQSGYERFYDVTFDYTDYYAFEGVQLTSLGPKKIEPDVVSGEAYGSNEQYWSLPMETAGPMIFPAEFSGSGEHIYLHVGSVGFCFIFPMPPADPEAMKALTSCIAKGGC